MSSETNGTDQPQDRITLRDVAKYFKMHARERSSPKQFAAGAVEEVHRRWNGRERQPPEHIPDQRDLIREWFDTPDPRWLFFFDAGRFDFFDQLVGEYFDGDLRRCWNGGVGYTGDWAVRNLTGEYGNRGLFSWVQLRGFGSAEYDGRDHFAAAPDIQAEYGSGDTASVEERLQHLGYKEGDPSDPGPDRRRFAEEQSTDAVNRAVMDRLDDHDGGVIRYLKPHPPFTGLDDVTAGASKTLKTRNALESGDLTYGELTEAYVRTYREAFEAASQLAPTLPGDVAITADHGTCLFCGQLFHGRQLEMHDHLTHVPWCEIKGLA